MKYSFLTLILAVLLLGAGCWTKATQAQKDCSKAQNSYACHLDQALTSEDPTYCSYVASSKHALCLSAYAEISGKKIQCDQLKDQELIRHCNEYAPKGEILPPQLPIYNPSDQE